MIGGTCRDAVRHPARYRFRVAAFIAIGISIAAVVVSLFSLYYSRKQALAAENQTKALGQQLQLSEQARRDQLQPHVVVDLRPREPGSIMLGLFVTNLGATTAHDVKIEVAPPLRSSYGSRFEDGLEQAVSRTISTLPPGRELMWNMDTGPGLAGRPDLPREYQFTVHASGLFGPLEPVTSVVNLEVLLTTDLNTETMFGALSKAATSIDGLTAAIGVSVNQPAVQPQVLVLASSVRVAGRRKRRRSG